jgi:hypothetical protein
MGTTSCWSRGAPWGEAAGRSSFKKSPAVANRVPGRVAGVASYQHAAGTPPTVKDPRGLSRRNGCPDRIRRDRPRSHLCGVRTLRPEHTPPVAGTTVSDAAIPGSGSAARGRDGGTAAGRSVLSPSGPEPQGAPMCAGGDEAGAHLGLEQLCRVGQPKRRTEPRPLTMSPRLPNAGGRVPVCLTRSPTRVGSQVGMDVVD